MQIYNTQDIPIWYGNCSGYTLAITNDEGDFTSHLISQCFAIKDIVSLLENKTNVVVVELNKLSTYLNNTLRENVKQSIYFDGKFSEMTLSYIKEQRIIINDDGLTDNQKKLILEMYEEDEIFINNLENKFCVF
jgi:16S rRNA G966 N2-methylase RsmD